MFCTKNDIRRQDALLAQFGEWFGWKIHPYKNPYYPLDAYCSKDGIMVAEVEAKYRHFPSDRYEETIIPLFKWQTMMTL